jgi:hypothetical protein
MYRGMMANGSLRAMRRRITGYHRDEERDWVAELDCGHNQHVRHNPPWISRPWVTTEEGRAGMLGTELDCRKCDRGEAADGPPPDAQPPVDGGERG